MLSPRAGRVPLLTGELRPSMLATSRLLRTWRGRVKPSTIAKGSERALVLGTLGLAVVLIGASSYSFFIRIESATGRPLSEIFRPDSGLEMGQTWGSSMLFWSIPWPELVVLPSLHNPLIWLPVLAAVGLTWQRFSPRWNRRVWFLALTPILAAAILFSLSLFGVERSYLALVDQGLGNPGALFHGLGQSSSFLVQGLVLSALSFLVLARNRKGPEDAGDLTTA